MSGNLLPPIYACSNANRNETDARNNQAYNGSWCLHPTCGQQHAESCFIQERGKGATLECQSDVSPWLYFPSVLELNRTSYATRTNNQPTPGTAKPQHRLNHCPEERQMGGAALDGIQIDTSKSFDAFRRPFGQLFIPISTFGIWIFNLQRPELSESLRNQQVFSSLTTEFRVS